MKIKKLPTIDTKPEFPDFGAIIKKAREECGLSQLELAKEIGKKSATYISLIESGKRGVSCRDFYYIMHVTNYEL